jgi:hypothetical protein
MLALTSLTIGGRSVCSLADSGHGVFFCSIFYHTKAFHRQINQYFSIGFEIAQAKECLILVFAVFPMQKRRLYTNISEKPEDGSSMFFG